MNFLRSHIIKFGVIALICSGLAMSVTKPASAAQSNEEFANWLQSLTKKVDAPELQQKLRSLKTSKADLHRLIQQASQIVSQNNEDFNIPLKDASGDIQQILLVEWNQYQTGSAMAAVPSTETMKPSVVPNHYKSGFSGFISFGPAAEEPSNQCAISHREQHSLREAFNTAPMVSGIAIGAP